MRLVTVNGKVTTASLRNFSKEQQEGIYGDYYSAYLACEECGNDEAARHNWELLLQMRELWRFTPADVAVCEARVAHRRANAHEFIAFFTDAPDKEPTVH